MADLTVAAETCVALGATEHQFESFPGRDIALGALTVTRVLPVKGKRLVGPWCFLDRFGPLTFAESVAHGRRRASSHGVADRDVAARRRARSLRQPRIRIAASTWRRQRDDLGCRHRPRGADAGQRTAAG